MPVDLPVEPGQVLSGKFRVERLLGVGGMGVVLEATHLQLHERVALKFLLPHAVKDHAAVSRFEREARAAVKLKNEHVVRVMDVGTLDDGAPYMVMELLQGKDLAHIIKELGRLPVPVAVEYFTQICDAVGEAHALGIVHRDLKPENVFVTQKANGTPVLKVLDFGISKMTGDVLSLTKTTQVMGSPYYMSPEQLRASKDVDQRSDIWSLGAIFYEMLTGRVPFEADSLMELCTRVLESNPAPISTIRDDVPPEIIRVVEGCLTKDREQRFRTVNAVLQSFEPTMAINPTGSHFALQAITASRNTAPSVPDANPQRISGATNTTWNKTGTLETSGARRRQLMVGGAVAAAALVLLGVVLANVIGHRETKPDGIVQATSTTPTATSAGSMPSQVTVATTPTTTTTPSTTADKPKAKPDAGVATVVINKPITTTTATTTAKPKPKPDDDIPTVRR
jgi:eukaryotic-like serine/threonine-protein kinase